MLDLMRRETIPGGELYPSQIISAISAAAGVQRFRLLQPLISIVANTGEIQVLGAIEYQP
jgi:uncharacterized phage protein gp47/JayE